MKRVAFVQTSWHSVTSELACLGSCRIYGYTWGMRRDIVNVVKDGRQLVKFNKHELGVE